VLGGGVLPRAWVDHEPRIRAPRRASRLAARRCWRLVSKEILIVVVVTADADVPLLHRLTYVHRHRHLSAALAASTDHACHAAYTTHPCYPASRFGVEGGHGARDDA
jgi:hypothetical protein